MFVFVCAGCGAEVTAALSHVAFPAHGRQKYGNGIQLPVLMEPGTFAVDPDPWGPPWRRWDEIGPDEAAARGVYAPVYALSDAEPGTTVIAPGDTRGTVLIQDDCGGYCCGLDGGDGPNMACEQCGLGVATRVDDCSLWQAVWLAPDAVRRVPVDGTGEAAPVSWTALAAEGQGTPAFAPITSWGSRPHWNRWWSWNPQWEAAASQALAHLLAASRGRPVTVPDGMTARVFRRALDTLLPPGPPARRAVLAGPGLPAPDTHADSDSDSDADADSDCESGAGAGASAGAGAGAGADILLVPSHPRTGEIWAPSGPAATPAALVPLPAGVWLGLVFPERRLPVPASGGMPDGVLRDNPDAPLSPYPFRMDFQVFLYTLSRLPAVRSPWLRRIHQEVSQHRHTGLF
ncbi:hypothetical protein ACGFYV_05885 [Streptomyces sp. NPDC048297]|uniref:hypothetical protein n=1 Tax=Streptomyces sp. NPDC048297 TaxID=3365531 RepID=UPI003718264D